MVCWHKETFARKAEGCTSNTSWSRGVTNSGQNHISHIRNLCRAEFSKGLPRKSSPGAHDRSWCWTLVSWRAWSIKQTPAAAQESRQWHLALSFTPLSDPFLEEVEVEGWKKKYRARRNNSWKKRHTFIYDLTGTVDTWTRIFFNTILYKKDYS